MTLDDCITRWEIAQMLYKENAHKKFRHVRDRLTKRPDFPKPVKQSTQRDTWWSRKEIEQWMNGDRKGRVV